MFGRPGYKTSVLQTRRAVSEPGDTTFRTAKRLHQIPSPVTRSPQVAPAAILCDTQTSEPQKSPLRSLHETVKINSTSAPTTTTTAISPLDVFTSIKKKTSLHSTTTTMNDDNRSVTIPTTTIMTTTTTTTDSSVVAPTTTAAVISFPKAGRRYQSSTDNNSNNNYSVNEFDYSLNQVADHKDNYNDNNSKIQAINKKKADSFCHTTTASTLAATSTTNTTTRHSNNLGGGGGRRGHHGSSHLSCWVSPMVCCPASHHQHNYTSPVQFDPQLMKASDCVTRPCCCDKMSGVNSNGVNKNKCNSEGRRVPNEDNNHTTNSFVMDSTGGDKTTCSSCRVAKRGSENDVTLTTPHHHLHQQHLQKRPHHVMSSWKSTCIVLLLVASLWIFAALLIVVVGWLTSPLSPVGSSSSSSGGKRVPAGLAPLGSDNFSTLFNNDLHQHDDVAALLDSISLGHPVSSYLEADDAAPPDVVGALAPLIRQQVSASSFI